MYLHQGYGSVTMKKYVVLLWTDDKNDAVSNSVNLLKRRSRNENGRVFNLSRVFTIELLSGPLIDEMAQAAVSISKEYGKDSTRVRVAAISEAFTPGGRLPGLREEYPPLTTLNSQPVADAEPR